MPKILELLLAGGIISVYLPPKWSCFCSSTFYEIASLLHLKANGMGHTNVGYIDDLYLQGLSFEDCSNNVQDTVHLFTKVGFLLNQKNQFLF